MDIQLPTSQPVTTPEWRYLISVNIVQVDNLADTAPAAVRGQAEFIASLLADRALALSTAGIAPGLSPEYAVLIDQFRRLVSDLFGSPDKLTRTSGYAMAEAVADALIARECDRRTADHQQ